jgi:hypothetical protein
MQSIQPSCTSSQDKSARPCVRHNSGGKRETCRLRRSVHCTQQTPSPEPRSPGMSIDMNFTQLRKIDDESVIACPEACQAVAPATNRRDDLRSCGNPHAHLDIIHVKAAGNQGWPAIENPIPYRCGLAVPGLSRPKQSSFEMPADLLENILDAIVHELPSRQASMEPLSMHLLSMDALNMNLR